MKALKPCPFCGSAPWHEPWYGGRLNQTMVLCSNEDCVATPSVVGETPELAADKWNQRAQPEPAPITTD